MDKFTKLFIITAVLIAVATPFIVGQYQTYQQEAKGKSDSGNVTTNGCNYSVSYTGESVNGGETKSYNLNYCLDGTEGGYVGWVTWGKIDPTKDLAVTITTPAGQTFTYDNANNATESFYDYFANPKGTFVFKVINKGTSKVSYDFAAAAVSR